MRTREKAASKESTSGLPDAARRLRALRLRAHLSMREVARRAGVAVSYVSSVEGSRISPTLATLRKLLLALSSDIGPFFSDAPTPPAGQVFRRYQMRVVSDAGRNRPGPRTPRLPCPNSKCRKAVKREVLGAVAIVGSPSERSLGPDSRPEDRRGNWVSTPLSGNMAVLSLGTRPSGPKMGNGG
jgi:transcriptional regulator with XRE-family HTH domain